MKTIAIALQKGGAGKTTTTVSDVTLEKLAEVWLHQLRDYSKPGTFYLGELDIQLFVAALEAWIARGSE